MADRPSLRDVSVGMRLLVCRSYSTDLLEVTVQELSPSKAAVRLTGDVNGWEVVSDFYIREHLPSVTASALETCPECFGDKTVAMSDGSNRPCTFCSAANRGPVL